MTLLRATILGLLPDPQLETWLKFGPKGPPFGNLCLLPLTWAAQLVWWFQVNCLISWVCGVGRGL